ncbi:uncharacterized protein LOC135113507 [Scylla paramamosain]|uniref:uncharacterized protein LOC135113507 n=1 Tax=Scylla paramamosain TaxID=85552 RepID=UPI003083608C
MEGAEGGILPHEPIPAPPMFSGESPGVADTTSEEESLYGGLLDRLRDAPEEEAWLGLPRSQSYSEGSLQQVSAPALPHAQSHHALLEDAAPPPQQQREQQEGSHSCLHALHTVVACQQEQIRVLQGTLRDLAATYTRRERSLLARLSALQQARPASPAKKQASEAEVNTGSCHQRKDSIVVRLLPTPAALKPRTPRTEGYGEATGQQQWWIGLQADDPLTGQWLEFQGPS